MEDEDPTIRVFLSYSHKDKELAGEIKKRLEEHGLEAFLAHEDIERARKYGAAMKYMRSRAELFIYAFGGKPTIFV